MPLSLSTVNVALIGAGGMATGFHYPSLAEMDDVNLVGICDFFPEKAAEAANSFGIPKTYTDYRAMLDETKPDAVYALMPPHHVFDVAVDVLKRKHHLFIEKPPGLTAFQNRELARHARGNGVSAMCGFQRRHVPLINGLRKRVEAKGPIHTAVVTFVKYSIPMNGYYDGAIDILSCDAVHAVDTLRHLCGGDVVSVASSVRALGSEEPNATYALVTFSTGATGVLQTNWACGRRFFKAEMHAEGVSAYADPDAGGQLYCEGDEAGEHFSPADFASGDSDWRRLGFYDESRHFIDCIKDGTEPDGSLNDTVHTMELVDRIYHGQI
jgi:predicted dehydrogenase